MKRKNKGGFSLTEVVISMALIVMVSITALTIALSSITTKVKAISRSHAQYFAENVWECFKVAETKDEFEQLFSVIDTHDHEIKPSEGERDDGLTYYIYEHTSTNYQFIAEIAVRYVNGERPKLKVNVSDDKGTIISFSYEKGVTYNEAVPIIEEGGNET